jgi:hypothetical protein
MFFIGTRTEIRFSAWLFIFIAAGATPFLLHVGGKLLNVWPINSGVTSPVSYAAYAVIIWFSLASLVVTMANIGMWASFFLRTKQELRTGIAASDNGIDVFSIFMSYCFGGTLGILLLFVFAGGFVQGVLFPEFQFAQNSLFSLKFLGRDWSRLIVWAFLAGFSERLIPNFLNDLVGRFAKAPETSPRVT